MFLFVLCAKFEYYAGLEIDIMRWLQTPLNLVA